MRTQRDYYEILGVPPTASAAEIKRRYRELARKFHPDVVKDKTFGHRAFTQITEAYHTLSDPDLRRAYDASRSSSSSYRPGARPSPGPPRSPGARQAPPQGPRPEPGRLVREAEFAFIRGRLNEAANLCRQAIRANRANARAHAILGDVYRAQGKKDQAVLEYSYAVQFNPADRDSQAKLEKLLPRGARPRAGQAARRRREQAVDYREEIRSAKNMANMAGWGMAFFLLFLINLYPGKPGLGLEFLPSISTWSVNLVALLAADGALVGVLLSANRVLADPDEELLFQHVPGTMIPIGFPLLIFSAVFFYAAAGGLILLNLLQGMFSKSLMCLFAAVTVITLLAALMYEPGRAQVALFGGNVAFPSAVLGWYVGRVFGAMDR